MSVYGRRGSGILDKLYNVRGRPESDMFASRDNNRLDKYISREFDREVIATDSLSMRWHGIKGYFFPSFMPVMHTTKGDGQGIERDPNSTKLANTAVVLYADETARIPTSPNDTNQGGLTRTEGKD